MRIASVLFAGFLVLAPVGAVVAEPTAAPLPAASAAPVASASPSVLDTTTIDVDGTLITVRDLVDLLAGVVMVYTPPKSAHPSSVLVTKPQSEMPAYDPDWHYAGSQPGPFDQPQLTIWVSDRLNGKAPHSLMESTAVLGLLDAGFGGARLQQAYGKARDADTALGPEAADPRKNRRALSATLTTMLDKLMGMLSH